MPLIPQQDIVWAAGVGGPEKALATLREKLDAYPPVRIVSISMSDMPNPFGKGSMGTKVVAVIETI